MRLCRVNPCKVVLGLVCLRLMRFVFCGTLIVFGSGLLKRLNRDVRRMRLVYGLGKDWSLSLVMTRLLTRLNLTPLFLRIFVVLRVLYRSRLRVCRWGRGLLRRMGGRLLWRR